MQRERDALKGKYEQSFQDKIAMQQLLMQKED
jgi:hypothetical protein